MAQLPAPPPSESAPLSRVELPPSLPEYVCRLLRDDILSGALTPGERITEAQVIERTGVSRTPVREGLRMLEAEGLVVSHRGRGTYVGYRLAADEALLIYDVRLIVEPHLTKLAAERMTAEDLASVRYALAEFAKAVDSGPRLAGQRDADLHLAIYDASRSELRSVLRGYWSRMQLELSERVYTTELPNRFIREHEEIVDALESGDGDRASECMSRHIAHGRDVIDKAIRTEKGEQ
ncbi:MAG TPA: GntR family transcriptional regulator [Solirubrobacter sp.]|nr:GntR family transcriptional regulator [Solirubrobacter sp.]